MTEQKKITQTTARHGLRLIKTIEKEHDILAAITGNPAEIAAARKSAASIAKAKENPLVRQLHGLADALDAEIAMIMGM